MEISDPKDWLLIVINAPVYWILIKLLFGDFQGFGDSVQPSRTNAVSAFVKGELLDEMWHSAKLLVFLYCCYRIIRAEFNYFFT